MVYKLTYFDVPVLGEVARWLFALADQDFDDIRVKYADWPKLKPSTPFGQLPTLEVDGVTVCQSGAINSFLARKFGFAGKDEIEQLRVDMVVGCIEDMVMQIVRPISYAPSPEVKAAARKGAQPKIDAFYEKLEALLVSNNGGDGYFVGDELSLADLMFVLRSSYPYRAQLRVPWAKLPKLKALKQRVLKNQKIDAWRKKHPEEPSFRLTYFDTQGRAEVSRLLFTLAGQKFEDIRLTSKEWLEIKPNTPFGQLPLLDVDDDTICQSNTIARYIANRFGFAGKTSFERAQTDMVIDCFEDFIAQHMMKWFLCQDPVEKAKLQKEVFGERMPNFLQNIEGLVESNPDSDKHFAGSEITWADVYLFSFSTMVGLVAPIDWTKYPKAKSVADTVASNPRIAEYVGQRPSPTKYVLTYFDVQARGEVPRILLTMGKMLFEDRRIKFEDWAKLKPETPFGGLPLLEFEGETYCQSTAISRYLAKQVGIAGKTAAAALKADMIVDNLVDYLLEMGKVIYQKDPELKKTLSKTFLEEKTPFTLAKLEEQLKKNNGGDGFFVDDEMTWCDVYFMTAIEAVTEKFDVKLTNYPKLKQLFDKLQKEPRILEWTQKRPEKK